MRDWLKACRRFWSGLWSAVTSFFIVDPLGMAAREVLPDATAGQLEESVAIVSRTAASFENTQAAFQNSIDWIFEKLSKHNEQLNDHEKRLDDHEKRLKCLEKVCYTHRAVTDRS